MFKPEDFPMCGHPEMLVYNKEKPPPVRTIGRCPQHDYVCPICGFGAGCSPPCGCESLPIENIKQPRRETFFGENIRDAIKAIRGVV